jgi:hypothetical protein
MTDIATVPSADLAALATLVSRRFVPGAPEARIIDDVRVEVTYEVARDGEGVAIGRFAKIISEARELETIFNTKLSLSDILIVTQF